MPGEHYCGLTTSGLNHPNIITIFDIGQVDSIHYIATEYIEGETLRAAMRKGLTLGQVLDVAIQTASALQAAHQAGIAHRGIKPENIMLRADGYVKVLDFGLAKLAEKPGLPSDTQAATIAKVETDPGTVMGTASYMSPEQARGRDVDARTVARRQMACHRARRATFRCSLDPRFKIRQRLGARASYSQMSLFL